jgi:hypothetical protein
MKLVWQTTGDFIELKILNHDVMYFLINHWETENHNTFYVSEKINIENILKDLQDSLLKTNNLLVNLLKINDLNLPVSFDQDNLNLLHERWVLLHQKYPMLGKLLEKKQKDAEFHLGNINKKIHMLEESFSINIDNRTETPVYNTFNSTITNFDVSNIFLYYKNLGKRTYDKWLTFDKSLKNTDRNDFIEIYGNININLNRPYSGNPSKNYIDWCNANDLYAAGDKINLANFVDLENNLTIYRELFIKNFSNINNPLKFVE